MSFSFHCIGQQFQGVLGCSATWLQRLPAEGGTEDGGDAPLCEEVFQINYLESPDEIEERFREWLEHALERGLAMWEATTF